MSASYAFVAPAVYAPSSSTLPLYRPSVMSGQLFKQYVWMGRDPTRHCDMAISAHANSVCLIALAPHHELCRLRQRIASISFCINQRDYAAIELSGKRKRGALTVDAHTPVLCSANASGGTHTHTHTHAYAHLTCRLCMYRCNNFAVLFFYAGRLLKSLQWMAIIFAFMPP